MVTAIGTVASDGSKTRKQEQHVVVAKVGQAMVVNIRSPASARKIYADRPLRLPAKVTQCKGQGGKRGRRRDRKKNKGGEEEEEAEEEDADTRFRVRKEGL